MEPDGRQRNRRSTRARAGRPKWRPAGCGPRRRSTVYRELERTLSASATPLRARSASKVALSPSYGAARPADRVKPKRLHSATSPWRIGTVSFAHQPLQCRRIVDIVPRRQFHEIKAELGRPCACCCSHGACAPHDVGEQPRIGKAHSKEVVSAVIARSQHHAPIIVGEESFRSGNEELSRECRRVGTQHARGSVTRREHLLDGVEQAAAEPLYAVGNR